MTIDGICSIMRENKKFFIEVEHLNKDRRNSLVRGILFFLLAMGLLFFWLWLTKSPEAHNIQLGQSAYTLQKDGWLVSKDSTTWQEVELPYELDVAVGQKYYSSYTFSNGAEPGSTMRLRASMQDVNVFLDGKLLFSGHKPPSNYFQIPNASVWHFVTLPEDLGGKTLTMEWIAREEAFAGTLNEVAFGEGDALLYNLIETQASGIILTLLLLIFGVISLFAALFLKNYRDNQFIYLGLFALCMAVWVFSEARLMQLITGSWFVVGGISYMALVLLPGLFLMFLKNAVIRRFEKPVLYMAIPFFVLFIVNLALQLSGVAGFFDTIKWVNALMAFSVITILILLFVEGIKDGNLLAKKMLLYFSLIGGVLILEISQFFLGYFEYISSFSRVGVVLFFALLGRESLQNFDVLLGKEREREWLEKIAYMDILTGGNNRNAFERDTNALVANSPNQCFRMVFLDINNLKAINDTFGHVQGDRLIITCYNLLKMSFGEYGQIYRMGGDEFSCLMYDTTMETYTKKLKQLQNLLAGLKDWEPYPVEVAVGSDIYCREKEEEFQDFYHRVDQMMYKNKRLLKKNTGS